jgi:hypothetical protein
MWLSRPPTRVYWRRGLGILLRHGADPRRMPRWLLQGVSDIVLNRFI